MNSRTCYKIHKVFHCWHTELRVSDLYEFILGAHLWICQSFKWIKVKGNFLNNIKSNKLLIRSSKDFHYTKPITLRRALNWLQGHQKCAACIHTMQSTLRCQFSPMGLLRFSFLICMRKSVAYLWKLDERIDVFPLQPFAIAGRRPCAPVLKRLNSV